MALTDKAIKSFKPLEKQYKKYDEKGLYLLVHPNGSKYWKLKYRFGDKEKTLSISVYPEVSLLEAREKTLESRKKLSNNIDPSEEKQISKLTSSLNKDNSFESIAREWLDKMKGDWTDRHSKSITRRLEIDVFPVIGTRPINEVTAPELLAILKNIETRGALDIARRIRQTTGQIFRHAIVTGRTDRDLSYDLKGALKVRRKQNFKFLKEHELGAFLRKLDNCDCEAQTRLGFK